MESSLNILDWEQICQLVSFSHPSRINPYHSSNVRSLSRKGRNSRRSNSYNVFRFSLSKFRKRTEDRQTEDKRFVLHVARVASNLDRRVTIIRRAIRLFGDTPAGRNWRNSVDRPRDSSCSRVPRWCSLDERPRRLSDSVNRLWHASCDGQTEASWEDRREEEEWRCSPAALAAEVARHRANRRKNRPARRFPPGSEASRIASGRVSPGNSVGSEYTSL